MHLAHLAVLATMAAVTECRSGSAVTGPGDVTFGSPRARGPVVDLTIQDARPGSGWAAARRANGPSPREG